MQDVPDIESKSEGLTIEERQALCHVFDENRLCFAETDHFSDTHILEAQ